VFEREITLALKKIQGGTSHTGKTPYEIELDKKLLLEYEMLIKEKERAGIEQRFADMNELSAQILDLAEELKRRGLI
jgi:protein-arginine kinase activator protein McsA